MLNWRKLPGDIMAHNTDIMVAITMMTMTTMVTMMIMIQWQRSLNGWTSNGNNTCATNRIYPICPLPSAATNYKPHYHNSFQAITPLQLLLQMRQQPHLLVHCNPNLEMARNGNCASKNWFNTNPSTAIPTHRSPIPPSLLGIWVMNQCDTYHYECDSMPPSHIAALDFINFD